MEKIDGPDGVSLMKNPTIQRLREDEKVTLIKYIIHSLLTVANHAKHAGVVHNDIKPNNFMFDKNGILKVIDWGGWGPVGGTAWAGTRGYEAPESRKNHVETLIVPRLVSEPRTVCEAVTVKTKGFLGFPMKRTTYRYRSYMHTEVKHFQEQHALAPCADERSDVFSIGVVLKELMDKLHVQSRLGEALYRGMTVLDRGKRLDIDHALNKSFLQSVNVRKATAIVKNAL
jgi:serine/threonine protein kinase